MRAGSCGSAGYGTGGQWIPEPELHSPERLVYTEPVDYLFEPAPGTRLAPSTGEFITLLQDIENSTVFDKALSIVSQRLGQDATRPMLEARLEVEPGDVEARRLLDTLDRRGRPL